MALTASIVVNTYNRARSLERLLPALDHLEGGRFEVIVVNGPSTDDTEAVLAEYRSRLKAVRCDTPNLSRSRNIGIDAAAGDVVVFIDDDAIPAEPVWLARLLEVFDRDVDGRIGAAGGASIHRDTDWTEFAGGWTSDFAEQRFTDSPDAVTEAERGRRAARPRPSTWYRRTVGNNSAFRRSALVAIGGFDEHFAYYLDEADVCLRLARAGFETVYLNNAAVRHYPAGSPIGPPFIRNRRLIARSDTYYCLKNGSGRFARRVVETLRRAPRKHFVTELRRLRAEGRISATDLLRLRWHWARGVVEGLLLGMTSGRATRPHWTRPSAFLPYSTRNDEPRLSIALLSRRLPPDPHAGGVARYTYDLARGLHARGHRVTLVTESDVPRRRISLGFEVAGVRATASRAGFAQTPVLGQNIAYAEAVRSFMHAEQRHGAAFDVVHATNWGLEALGLVQDRHWPIALMLVTPLESVMAAEGWGASQDLSANIALDQWTVEHADRVCAPSLAVLDSYADREAWTGRAVHAVPLGTVLSPAERRDEGRGDRSSRLRKLLFVGRHERRKGIHLLLDVLPQLLERHPDWCCDLIGNNKVPAAPGATFESVFMAQHAGTAWTSRVRFLGPVADADLPGHYATADLFVAPSLFESFGLIYLEAMQHGVPVVAARVGGVPEVVADGEEGLLVPPGDAAALGRALDRLMTDDAERTRLGANAERSVRASRSHLAMADRMLVEYRALLDQRLKRPAIGHLDEGRSESTSVVDRALAALEAVPSTRGLSLAYRAMAAFDGGDRADASALVAEALTLTGHPDYYAMAVELALADDDHGRAASFATRGFAATADDSESCLVFAAVLLGGSPDTANLVTSSPWFRARRAVLPGRLLSVAMTAIRSNRDGTANALLRAGQATATSDRALHAHIRYHLGSLLKRRGQHAEAMAILQAVCAGELQVLPASLQSALHFHLGELWLLEGRSATAASHLRACLSLNPEHGRARALLVTLMPADEAA